jgi:hypothetical protein
MDMNVHMDLDMQHKHGHEYAGMDMAMRHGYGHLACFRHVYLHVDVQVPYIYMLMYRCINIKVQ